MKREKIIELAKILKLTPTEEVIASLEKEANQIFKMLDDFKQINVEGVEPLTRLSEIQDFNFREDEAEDYTENKEIILKNAPKKNEDFVVLERVINND
ncbi:Asp-tRNA(Asn)/Glu-tRNA(Gln) amidotransferase subunit GatC [Mycoplasma procyoni]|uniref:Asp-tRNA(Asn)/Glu-tRNA(Gln) amidotransferase subunit GatC n=1 Tax=Mycoplasma procyoni TaxID=568784 RepID=UPI00197C4478|nr:aspartyl/glutamyl-tRNA amidotransferase subunit C [Mycoplasma procyoni]MBN3535054.1 hypothetical protein [Mycoplasma procyoni]